MDDKLKCPKCSGRMTEGWIAEFSHQGGLPSKWVEGQPEMHSFWSAGIGAKMPQEKTRGIVTFCCDSCGYLEPYARQEKSGPGWDCESL